VRARYPDFEGYVARDGVKVGYEVLGDGAPALVFSPLDAIVSSRAWKAQVPYLARTSKVINIDPRGNGRSDRPGSSAGYADENFVADTIEVMDAVGVERAVLVGMCASSWFALLTAARHPDRVLGVVSVAAWLPHLPARPVRQPRDFTDVIHTDADWTDEHWAHWGDNWQGYAEKFFGEALIETHSSKQREDCVE